MDDNICESASLDSADIDSCSALFSIVFDHLQTSIIKTTEDVFNEVAKSQSKTLLKSASVPNDL
jgi:hypothetical protein